VLFITPMTGAYAVMRLVLPVVPEWALHGVAVLALLTSVYAAAMAVVQIEARRFFAFLFISHSALVLAGLEIATPIGMTGGLCVWLGSGLALCGLALTLRAVEARIGRITLDQYHGLFEHMPHLGAFYLLTALASIGFPGSLAFIGMELLVEGTVAVYPVVGTMVVLAAVLNGVAVFRAYFRIFTGTRHVATIPLSARPVERLAIISLSLLVLGAGLWPGPAVRGRYHAADSLLKTREASGIDGDAGAELPEPSALDAWLHTESELERNH
jgi:NADH-quinone oxidoreductase subunit M